jgi:DNA-binding NarL/FixJ family response regulator
MSAIVEPGLRAGAKESHLLAAPKPVRPLVVDDHLAVRRGLRELLEQESDFVVVAAVSCAEGAMSVAEREQLDVAVVDYQRPGRNGLWVSRKLKRLPSPPGVLVYSAYSDALLAAAAVAAEADGVLSKGGLGSELCTAIRSIAGGRRLLLVVPWPVAELMRCRLDDEEQAIFGMSLAGIPRVEIAKILGISQSGLESRLWETLRKLEGMDADLTPPLAARARPPLAAG